jgi:hypothetical protein
MVCARDHHIVTRRGWLLVLNRGVGFQAGVLLHLVLLDAVLLHFFLDVDLDVTAVVLRILKHVLVVVGVGEGSRDLGAVQKLKGVRETETQGE